MTRGTNLMQQFWFIIINISTCFGHLYAHLQEYRFVYYCIWCSALGVVAVVLRSRCVVLCTVCKFVSDRHGLPNLRNCGRDFFFCFLTWRWAYRCPKHVEIFMIINQNCCIKLVPLVIFIYDARSHIHQRIFCWPLPVVRVHTFNEIKLHW